MLFSSVAAVISAAVVAAGMLAVAVLVLVVTALDIGIVVKIACEKRFDNLVALAGDTAVELDAGLVERRRRYRRK